MTASHALIRLLSAVSVLAGGAVSVALGALSVPAPDVAARFDLLQNGGFEEGEKQPSFWRAHPKKDNDRNLHERDLKNARSGAASGRIVWLDPIAGPNKAGLQWNRYGLAVEGGSTLLFSGFAKLEAVTPGGAGVHMYDGEGGHLGFVKADVSRGPTEWRPFVREIVLPADARTIGVALYTRQGGTTWFDDVSLLGTPSTEAVRGTPRLDGELSDSCWADDRAIRGFVRHDGQGTAREDTRAWLAYDDQCLYVAFSCPFPAGSVLKQDADKRDGDTWYDDSIEVFVDPWHEHTAYFQLAVNCKGVVRDSRGQDVSWDSDARARVKRGEDAWCVEVSIPFRSLQLTLACRETWGINLVRNDRVNGETVTWSLGGFHQPGRFGNVALAPHLTPFILSHVRQRSAELEAARARIREEVAGVGLSPAVAPKVHALLAEAAGGIAELGAAGRTGGGGRQVSVAELRGLLRSVQDALKHARAAAVTQLFAADASTGEGRFSVVIARSLQKVLREGSVGDGLLARGVVLEAARDEVESFQLVLIPGGKPLTGVTVEAGPLRGPGGTVPVEWCRVGYVETGPPRRYHTEHVGWWPDILLPPGPVDLDPGRRQPVWFRVSVPPDAASGSYSGEVVLRGQGHAVTVPVELRVRGFRLPRPGSLPCAFGLYGSVLSEWYYGRKPYQSVMPLEAYARWCEFLGRYRLTPKNLANDYHRPPAEGREEDGPDLSCLRETVGKLAPDYYPPYSFCMFRLPCPSDVRDGTTKVDPKVWVRSIAQRRRAYRDLGLPSTAYIYGIDEPHEKAYPFVASVYRLVREVAPDFPIMQTVNQNIPEDLVGLVDIWCPLSARLWSGRDFYKRRIAAGETVWSYICCGPVPPHANFFIDEPAIDHRMVFWQARQAGATGVLYWCVCYWRGLPGPPSGKPHFPDVPVRVGEDLGTYKNFGVNGDGVLVWPGPNMTPYPSVRLEVVRDGIEDYEYLALLARCVSRCQALAPAARPPQALLRQAEALCQVPATISRSFTEYTKDPSVLLARRRRVGDAIEKLVAHLGKEPPPVPPSFARVSPR